MDPRTHKPADSGVTVGNDARSCSFYEVTLTAFKHTCCRRFIDAKKGNARTTAADLPVARGLAPLGRAAAPKRPYTQNRRPRVSIQMDSAVGMAAVHSQEN